MGIEVVDARSVIPESLTAMVAMTEDSLNRYRGMFVQILGPDFKISRFIHFYIHKLRCSTNHQSPLLSREINTYHFGMRVTSLKIPMLDSASMLTSCENRSCTHPRRLSRQLSTL